MNRKHHIFPFSNWKFPFERNEAIRHSFFYSTSSHYHSRQTHQPRTYNNFYDKIFITHAGYAINLYYYSRRTWWVVKIDEQKICSIDCSKLFTLPATILIIQCVFFLLVLPPHTSISCNLYLINVCGIYEHGTTKNI